VFVNRARVLEVYREAGVEPDEERFIDAELHARTRLSQRVEEGGTGTERHVWQDYFVTLLRRSGVPEEALADVGDRLKAEHEREHLWTHVESGTREALEELLDGGYRLGVISNADGRVEEVIRSVGLRDLVEFVVDSHVVGVEKPDPRIFRAGIRQLGLKPAECLYVGDLYPVDVLGARGAGMEALLVDPSGKVDRPVDRVLSVRHVPEYLAGPPRPPRAGR
jgi:putative hydrolase of the HAD superfamily